MVTFKKWSLLQTGKLCSKFGAILTAAIMMVSCGDDDDDIDTAGSIDGASNIRIVEVDAINDQITLKNFGDADGDISSYFFCNQRRYVAFSETENNGSDFILTPNEEISFTISINDNASDVAIYNRGGAFTSASAMVDFMQYGASFAGNGGREDVAVEKGIWTAGEFVEGGSPYAYEGDGATNGASTWEAQEVLPDESSTVRLLSIDPLNDVVTLKNFGDTEEDISGYFFCRRKGYAGLSTLTVVSGDLLLSSDEEVQFTISVDDTSSDFALYANNEGFANADNIIDFFQFGSDIGDDGRISVAVEAGIWDAGEFLEGNAPFIFEGGVEDFGSSFWSGTTGSARVRLLSIDPIQDKVVLKNFGDAPQDISGYFFCRRKAYANIGGITPTNGDFILEPNEEVEFTLSIDDNSSDVAIYLNNAGFGDAANMIDFMQFGDDVDSDGRENVAVAAGLWTENDYINGVGPYTYGGDGSANGKSEWTPAESGEAKVRLLSVDPATDLVTLKNFGNASKNISEYFFCLRKIYPALSSLEASGNLILAPNEELELTVSINDTSSDVGLYINNSGFASSANILDFMQFGEDVDGAGRENVAVEAGIWTEDEFVSNPGPFEYSGNGDQRGASFWEN